ncbi:MAG TPA: hypothetical protein VFX33_08855 [Actinomycetales bacterium]|nr:hypothetical protein [Actinomycetales bacterium]
MDDFGTQPGRRRPLAGVVVGIALLAVVAVPAFWTGVFAVAAVSGCFMECSKPDPAAAALWGGVTVVLLVVPISAGLAVARARQRWAGIIFAVAVAALGVFGWLTQGAI